MRRSFRLFPNRNINVFPEFYLRNCIFIKTDIPVFLLISLVYNDLGVWTYLLSLCHMYFAKLSV